MRLSECRTKTGIVFNEFQNSAFPIWLNFNVSIVYWYLWRIRKLINIIIISIILFFFDWNVDFCCLVFDILEDMTALGMESGAINDSRISASSSYDIYHGPPRARLHTMKTSSGKGAWSSKIADAHQWIQVDLVELKNVTYIATQGRNGVNQYVTMYKLEESSDGVNFTSYKMQGDSSATVSRFC